MAAGTLLLCILGLTLLGNRGIDGWRLQNILSGSMVPTLPVGSVVLTKKELPDRYTIGDIITFQQPAHKTLITHRIVDRQYSATRVLLFTVKGDANPIPDPFPISAGAVLGKVMFVLPRVGYLIYALHLPIGFAAVVLLTFFTCVMPLWLSLTH